MRPREKGESVTSENRLAYMRPTQATLKEARAPGITEDSGILRWG